MLTYKEFFKITKNLDREKYHTCCSVKSDYTYCDWWIYRKDMSFDEYWSPNNKALLSSESNSDLDLIDFCNANTKERNGLIEYLCSMWHKFFTN